MHSAFAAAPAQSAIPITFVTKSTWEPVGAALDETARRFAEANGFAAKPGQYLALPAASGEVSQVLFGLGEKSDRAHDPFLAGKLPGLLPAGTFRFANAPHDVHLAVLAFALGSYRFGRYRKADAPRTRLVPPDAVDIADISRMAEAAALARDLINTPANDMGPAELEAAARDLASGYDTSFDCVIGDDLLKKNFPLIHAVGMASPRAPRLIDFSWGDPAHPKITLVGKGVCFDTGGVDLKPSSGMLIMKKDMGGAANVLALAQMIMDATLKVRLRVLIPAVENAVAGNAFRPLDIFPSRKGPTVEIGNTDAEGRLVLADALALADEEKPDLLIDLGTLTGAARVALGPDLPPFYTNDDKLALDVARCADAENDPLWRMPLWPRYDAWLDSKVADINNAPSGGFAGSITCALFLQRFVEAAKSWLHVDIYGWTPSAKPARPEGGECQAARAIYKLLSERYG
jgi:leucyl aminopeptidase